MSKNLSAAFFASLSFLLFSCQTPTSGPENPPAPGFNLEASDPEAIAVADSVMKAMGGRESWDNTRILSWVFFGFRKLTWDKKNGNVRIESFPDTATYLVNIHSLEGKVKIGNKEVTNPDTLKMHLERGKSIWINDAYWLIMPFKLKDSGVTLNYLGEERTEDGQPADVLKLTFDNVGDTPQNKYHVFVDKSSHLVTQWSFFRDAAQDTADFTTPWKDYRQYGEILLSGDRGKRKITEIAVYEELPDSVFTNF